MILDNLKNADLYRGLGPRFAAAFAFLQKTDFAALAAGKNPVIPGEVFALRVESTPLPEAECLWEAHVRHADIHCQIAGGEAIGYAPVESLRVTQPCPDGEDDILLAGKGRLIALRPGEFMVFFPTDAHMTGVADGTNATSRKIVVKVRLDP